MEATTRAASYGTRNSYRCEACAGIVVTQDLEEGVTPYLIPCLATEGCMGLMRSDAYKGPLGGKEALPVRPHYFWRKPTPEEYARMSPSMRHHVDQGGLEIYPATVIDMRSLPPRPL